MSIKRAILRTWKRSYFQGYDIERRTVIPIWTTHLCTCPKNYSAKPEKVQEPTHPQRSYGNVQPVFPDALLNDWHRDELLSTTDRVEKKPCPYEVLDKVRPGTARFSQWSSQVLCFSNANEYW
jgi:hypothetical protein